MSDREYQVAGPDELPADGGRLLVDLDGREVVVLRTNGEYHALANFCPHQAGPLGEGELCGQMHIDEEGETWEYDESEPVVACPWHGWKFDVETGANAQTDRYRVPTYDIEQRDDGLYVLLR